MIEKTQLRTLVRDTLKFLEPEITYSIHAENLILLTAAVESNLGTYIEQVKGPAKGIYQMEPATEKDIWINFLAYKKPLSEKLNQLRSSGALKEEMKWNLAYATAMTRVHYYRKKVEFEDGTVRGLANIWKLHYNTPLGKGTPDKAIEKYMLMVGV